MEAPKVSDLAVLSSFSRPRLVVLLPRTASSAFDGAEITLVCHRPELCLVSRRPVTIACSLMKVPEECCQILLCFRPSSITEMRPRALPPSASGTMHLAHVKEVSMFGCVLPKAALVAQQGALLSLSGMTA